MKHFMYSFAAALLSCTPVFASLAGTKGIEKITISEYGKE